MRKKFVYFILVPIIILFVVVYLFIDSWIESGLEYGGEKAVGAKVEIDNLQLTLSPIGIEISRLRVTNPNDGWKNMFETGKVKFALNFGQLLRGKYIIETMEVNDFILGTKRTTDGSIPKPKEIKKAEVKHVAADSTAKLAPPPLAEQAKPALVKDDAKPATTFDLDKIKKQLNVDSLLNPNNLAAYRRIDSLKKQINDASIQWQTTLADFDKSKVKLTDVESRAKSIDVNSIKDLNSANNALTNAKTTLKEASEIKSSFEERKAVLTDGVNNLGESIRDVDNLVKEDFQKILDKAQLPDLSMKGISEMVLGKDLLNKAHQYLGYIDMAKSKIQNSSDKPEIEKPERFKGQNIHFAVDRAYPKFWIRKILISGGTDKAQDPQYFYARGQVLNITNDQRITHYPLAVNLSATKGGTTTLNLDATFDRRKELSVDNYNAQLTGLQVNDMSLGRSDFLPTKVTNAVADAAITIEVPGDRFNANANIAFNNMKLLFNRDPVGIVERIAHDVLASITGFNVNLRMWLNENKFDIAFTTDLDDQLTSRTKQVIGAEVAKIQADLRNKFNAQLAAKRAEVEKLFNEKREMVTNKVKEYENQLNEKLAIVDDKKKEIEDRIEQEKKKQTDNAAKKAKDALKGLFK